MAKNPYLLAFLISLLLIACEANKSTEATPLPCNEPGTVQYLTIESTHYIGIYLPPCYVAESGQLYPVLYLMPGFGGSPQNWFDGGLAAIADESIGSDEVPPFVIVASNDTRDDLDAPFILQDIVPYIESNYQVSDLRQHRAVAGGSLGGASAYRLVFKHPDLFASAGIFGNGAAVGDEADILQWLATTPKASQPRIFINCGEQDAYMVARAEVLITLLEETGIEYTEVFSPGNHSVAYWLSNFPTYFHWLAQDW